MNDNWKWVGDTVDLYTKGEDTCFWEKPTYPGHTDAETLCAKVNAILYWYESGSYEGDGLALVAWKDYTYSFVYLGHCSCNDPEDNVLVSTENRRHYTWNQICDMSMNNADENGNPADNDYAKLWKMFDEFEFGDPHNGHMFRRVLGGEEIGRYPTFGGARAMLNDW